MFTNFYDAVIQLPTTPLVQNCIIYIKYSWIFVLRFQQLWYQLITKSIRQQIHVTHNNWNMMMIFLFKFVSIILPHVPKPLPLALKKKVHGHYGLITYSKVFYNTTTTPPIFHLQHISLFVCLSICVCVSLIMTTMSPACLHIKNRDCWKCITPFTKEIKKGDSNSNFNFV